MTLPLKSDGLLDYTRMSLAQTRDDLIETVSDLVFNAGQSDLGDTLSELEEDSLSTSALRDELASQALVSIMDRLAALETDPRFHITAKPLLREAANLLVERLRSTR